MSRLQSQSQDVPSAARGTTRLRNRNPASGHLMLLLHLLRGAHCYVQKCCWGLSSRQRDLPGAQPRASQSGSADESFRGVDSTNHLEGTCKKEPCDSMTLWHQKLGAVLYLPQQHCSCIITHFTVCFQVNCHLQINHHYILKVILLMYSISFLHKASLR